MHSHWGAICKNQPTRPSATPNAECSPGIKAGNASPVSAVWLPYKASKAEGHLPNFTKLTLSVLAQLFINAIHFQMHMDLLKASYLAVPSCLGWSHVSKRWFPSKCTNHPGSNAEKLWQTTLQVKLMSISSKTYLLVWPFMAQTVWEVF